MSNKNIGESTKAALAIKTARTATGLNQLEFAELISVSKTTLARIETFEMPLKLETYFKAVRELKALGIEIDAMSEESIDIRITPTGQMRVMKRWSNMANRRSDKKPRSDRVKK